MEVLIPELKGMSDWDAMITKAISWTLGLYKVLRGEGWMKEQF
ncbi:hypothetical protein LINPERHAP1_LOCUS38768 [Linum perenne]